MHLYSIKSQNKLDFKLAKFLPLNHYARKNLGYLIAIKSGAEIIIETDDDNIPAINFWKKREKILISKRNCPIIAACKLQPLVGAHWSPHGLPIQLCLLCCM
jgi:hypothetical protein